MPTSEPFRRQRAIEEGMRQARRAARAMVKKSSGTPGLTGPTGAAGDTGPAGPSAGAVLDIRSVAISILTLGAGSSAEFVMTWSTSLGRTDYAVKFAPDNALIGKLTFAVKAGASKSATGMTIVATAVSAIVLTLGGVVHCHAVTPGTPT